jgi:hypothetical protein
MFTATESSPTRKILYMPDVWGKLASGQWKSSGNSAAVEAEIKAKASTKFPFSYHTYVSQSGSSLKLPQDYDPITNPSDGSARIVKAPTDIHPSFNPDSHMVVFQPDGTALETLGTIILSDGTIVAQTYKITDPKLNGDGWQNGITASMIPTYAGLIHDEEVVKGSIDHAIKIVAPAQLLDDAFVYPALSFDRGALSENPAYSGPIPMGGRLALPQNVDLNSLGLTTDFGRMIAKTAQEHGFIVTDRGGSGITLMVEGDTRNSVLDNYDNARSADLQKIFDYVKRVDFDVKTAPTNPNPTPTPTPNPDPIPAPAPTPNPAPETPSTSSGTKTVTKVGTGSDVLVLEIGQDAYQGDAQFAVKVDGVQVGGTLTAKALRANNVSELFEIRGNWGVGDHSVSVSFLNDLFGGSSSADRNLYVWGAKYNNTKVEAAKLDGISGTESFVVKDTTPVTATPSQPVPNPTPTPTPSRPATAKTLNGTSSSNSLTGTSGNDLIDGKGGNDALWGKAGSDVLIGGTGKDTFTFDTKPGSSNVDLIVDFNVADDTIRLNDSVFTKLKSGNLSSNSFAFGEKALDSSDRIIYNSKTGALSYDADGTGSTAAVKFAMIENFAKLTAADFIII